MNFPTEPTVARERDPVRGMNVQGDAAHEDGLVVEHDGTPIPSAAPVGGPSNWPPGTRAERR